MKEYLIKNRNFQQNTHLFWIVFQIFCIIKHAPVSKSAKNASFKSCEDSVMIQSAPLFIKISRFHWNSVTYLERRFIKNIKKNEIYCQKWLKIQGLWCKFTSTNLGVNQFFGEFIIITFSDFKYSQKIWFSPLKKGLTRFSDSRIRRSTRLLQKPIDQEMDSKICVFKMLEKFWNKFLFFYRTPVSRL